MVGVAVDEGEERREEERCEDGYGDVDEERGASILSGLMHGAGG